MALLACVLLLVALLPPAATTGTATALDGDYCTAISSVVTKPLSRVSPDAAFVADLRRPSVAGRRRLSGGVARPPAASPRPRDVKLAPPQRESPRADDINHVQNNAQL
ncbi:unnamed protein product, partial [Closterium sp. NIES-54]